MDRQVVRHGVTRDAWLIPLASESPACRSYVTSRLTRFVSYLLVSSLLLRTVRIMRLRDESVVIMITSSLNESWVIEAGYSRTKRETNNAQDSFIYYYYGFNYLYFLLNRSLYLISLS